MKRILIQYQISEGRLAQFSERKSIPYVNLNEEMKNTGIQIFTDYAHITPEGARLIAKKYLAAISDRIQKRIEKRGLEVN